MPIMSYHPSHTRTAESRCCEAGGVRVPFQVGSAPLTSNGGGGAQDHRFRACVAHDAWLFPLSEVPPRPLRPAPRQRSAPPPPRPSPSCGAAPPRALPCHARGIFDTPASRPAAAVGAPADGTLGGQYTLEPLERRRR
jgi:hypothetical protein